VAGLEMELEAIQPFKIPFKAKRTDPRVNIHVANSLVGIAKVLFGHEDES
jgi:hypothetical protein